MSESLTGGPGTPEQPRTATMKDEARGVAHDAASSAGAVGETAKEGAVDVAHEAKYQVKDLLHQSRRELMDQASQQQTRAAEGLRAIHQELDSMASRSEGQGVGTDLVRQAAQRTGALAEWLDQRDPGSLLNEVTSFARRKPGFFLAAAAGAGLLAGRLSRSLAAGGPDDGQGAMAARPTTPPSSAGVYGTETGDAYSPAGNYGSGDAYRTAGVYGAAGAAGVYGTDAYGTGSYGAGETHGAGASTPGTGAYSTETGAYAGAGVDSGTDPQDPLYAAEAAGTTANVDYSGYSGTPTGASAAEQFGTEAGAGVASGGGLGTGAGAGANPAASDSDDFAYGQDRTQGEDTALGDELLGQDTQGEDPLSDDWRRGERGGL
ncbi:hypothetical protein [Sinomonas halotolerans]|uniref:DUF3618 domain-containing protein n=1 Tax=Sinomonas halotolerans TaxID=1644133 RepID=A0ABU9WXH6_9MICC